MWNARKQKDKPKKKRSWEEEDDGCDGGDDDFKCSTRRVHIFCESCRRYFCEDDFVTIHMAEVDVFRKQGGGESPCEGRWRPLAGERPRRLPVGCCTQLPPSPEASSPPRSRHERSRSRSRSREREGGRGQRGRSREPLRCARDPGAVGRGRGHPDGIAGALDDREDLFGDLSRTAIGVAPPCPHFNYGRCVKGNECPFRHDLKSVDQLEKGAPDGGYLWD